MPVPSRLASPHPSPLHLGLPVPPWAALPTTSYSSVAPLIKALPSVTHIPALNTQHDIGSWLQFIKQTILNLGHYDYIANELGHVLDSSVNKHPNIMPSYLPDVLGFETLDTDHLVYTKWWEDDNHVQHVVAAKLGIHAHSYLIPGPVYKNTACSILLKLWHGMSYDNVTHFSALLGTLLGLCCEQNRVLNFVFQWQETVAQLITAHVPLPT